MLHYVIAKCRLKKLFNAFLLFDYCIYNLFVSLIFIVLFIKNIVFIIPYTYLIEISIKISILEIEATVIKDSPYVFANFVPKFVKTNF